jgi:hypothetical protein
VVLARAEAARIRAQVVLATRKSLPVGKNFAGALAEFGLSPHEAAGATAAAQHAFNLRQLRAGNTITVGRSVEGSLREISYKIDADRLLNIIPESQGFSAQVQEIASHVEFPRKGNSSISKSWAYLLRSRSRRRIGRNLRPPGRGSCRHWNIPERLRPRLRAAA